MRADAPADAPAGDALDRERRLRPVLGTTRSASFDVGSNRKGQVAAGNWWFALPRLEADDVLCLGAPSKAALATLAAMGGRVTIVGRRRRAGAAPNVSWTAAGPDGALPVAAASIDVAYVRGARRARRHAAELARALKPGGVVFVEGRELRRSRASTRAAAALERELGEARLLFVGPAVGEAKALAPGGDHGAEAVARRSVPARPRLSRRTLRQALPLLAAAPVAERTTRRYGVVASTAAAPAGRPPAYLAEMARVHGIDLERHTWALAAPGDYASQKVVVFLLGPDGRPEYIAKMTRAPRWNARLENEWRALTLLAERGVGGEHTRPQAAFRGTAAGIAVVGETAVSGTPFASRTLGTADCPYALAAVDRLVELGTRTADAGAVGPDGVAEALDDLLERFFAAYRSPEAEASFLRGQIDRVRAADTVPLVLAHGDPGPWNVLTTEDGHVAFLDWEAADPNGVPLWDLFYFLRSYGVAVSRRAGRTDPTASFEEHYLGDSPLAGLLLAATERACRETGLAPTLVEPLFHTCWMHRALKESTRLTSGGLDRGRFVRLLRLGIERREAPGLRRLFSLGG